MTTMPRYPVMGKVVLPTGEGMPLDKSIPAENFYSALKYQPDTDDVFVVTYPKNGTTWMLYILHLLKKGTQLEPGDNFHNHYASLDFEGADSTKNFPRPRLIKSHLRYSVIPKKEEAKYIFVGRNPKDTVVSFYHHTKGFLIYDFADGKFDDYFNHFMLGKCDFGNYFKMVPLWWEKSKTDENVHFLLYEDLKTDFKREMIKIAEFLGDGYKSKLLADDEKLLRFIAEKSSIKTMKESSEDFTPCGIERDESIPFTRKGVVGDWKNHLNEKQSEQLDDCIKKAAVDYPGFDELWKNYGVLS